MPQVKFELSQDFSSIEIIGSDFNLNTLREFYKIICKVIKENVCKELIIKGNFNSKLLVNTLFNKKKIDKLDEHLFFLQSITNTIENSKIKFIAFLNGIAKGPAMEIALSCNFIKAKEGTILDFDFSESKQLPFLGSIQRLVRILGYKNTLKTLLLDKTINFEKANKMKIINSNIDNSMYKENPFWDQNFTNTFIFFNSKIHSLYQNSKPAYNAILSIIFESSLCEYEIGLSIEQRWLKWLIIRELENTINK